VQDDVRLLPNELRRVSGVDVSELPAVRERPIVHSEAEGPVCEAEVLIVKNCAQKDRPQIVEASPIHLDDRGRSY
jgi:hypothetical protein